MADRVDVVRWQHNFEPNETTLRNLLDADCLEPYRWVNGPNDSYATHRHTFHKVLVVVRGSITFQLPELGDEVDLKAGDRLVLPANIAHSATVGPHGVVCLEAHCPY